LSSYPLPAAVTASETPASPARLASASFAALRWLPVLCIVLPLMAYAAVGTYRYAQVRGEADIRLERAVRVAAEHALKVLDTSESLLSRVQDATRQITPAQLRRQQPALHEELRRMAERKQQLQGLWVFGPDGVMRASSRFLPTPEVDVSDRDYFQWHRAGRGGVFVSQPLVSRSTGEKFLDLSLARLERDGSFVGGLPVGLLPAHFRRFHEDLIADDGGLAITMFREDGAVFSRAPAVASFPERLAPTHPVMARIGQGHAAGSLVSASTLDGRERLVRFQQVGDYPIFMGAGMDVADLRVRWAREMAWLAAFGLPPALGLFLVARLALRRTRESMAAALRLRDETEARRRVEEALLQSQKLEALGRLTGGVAHDFNNALMVISNNIELMKFKHPEVTAPYVASIGRAVGSATKLTRQLLAFSRRQALVPEQVELQQRLPGLRDLLAPVLGSRVRLAIEVAADTRPIRVDPAELELALINLAINARDALPQGGAFRLCAANARENPPPLAPGAMVVIEASDDGVGVAPELLGKVFEPFFTTKPVGAGTGLGLSQVYGLCQRAGGLATIASEPGRGTCVRLFFPADAQAADHAVAKPAALARDLHKHVLLVEDNAEVASALRPVLESFGCTVTWLDRAMEARDWLARQPHLPDLLLTDVIMPGGMDGVALAQHVRQRWPQLQVLLMTGYTEQLDTITRLGFQVLPKPCTVEVLSDAIRKATCAGEPA